MSQNCINDFTEKINNNYLCREFNLTKIPKKHKSLGKKVRDRQISQKDYNAITQKFFDIYYNELYYLNKPSYFFLGGFLQKKRSKPGVRKVGKGIGVERKKIHVEFPITISWTDLFFLNQKEKQIKYIKTKGSTSRVARIEKEWNKTNNFYDLESI